VSGDGTRRSARGALRGALGLVVATGALAWLAGGSSRPADGSFARAESLPGCLRCHEGIEPMHPEAKLSCVDCHGGDEDGSTKLEAHVPRRVADPGDERVPPIDEDLAWRRFSNPMDLRVAAQVCGPCHEDQVKRVHTSLHATTAGHLSDGFYENGLLPKKGSPYSVFPVPAHKAEPGDVASLVQVPPFRESGKGDALSTHYADLARKECMQCHLWSQGRAVQGRVGFDGDYRGEGCAACHVAYALEGLSESADRSAVRTEPGHPREHAMTRAPTTDACTSCHYGDASIGLNFRGLSQLPPGAPGGPEIPGSTDSLRNRQFYLDDPTLCPPDVHHEKGMHCIDCHTANDVMGDGRLHGAMEHAVEITCVACHGTFDKRATLRTRRGTPLEHLRRDGKLVILTSKVDGKEHAVPQVVDVLDPTHPAYNERAARAMTPEHGKLECHLCHSSWNPNFMGFHFDRNESLTQLDLLSGQKTKGRVTTQEKVFATWKSFYAGLDEEGRFAPYLTGFSTMGTVRDEKGETVVDQALPVTEAGLSGLTQIHHQMHTVRPTARSCVECHRSSATWGLGSVNFRLGRRLAFVADRRGLEVVALDRAQFSGSAPLAKIVLPDIVDLELEEDPLQGFARRLFAAEGYRGLHVIDVSDPTAPKRTQFLATVQPTGLAWAGDHLYLADGPGGVRVFRSGSGGKLEQVACVPTVEARAVHVQWPYLYVADGPGGVLVIDVREPAAPKVVGGSRLNEGAESDAAIDVSLLFQHSRPLAQDGEVLDRRTKARALLATLDENEGLVLFDATEPTALKRLHPPKEASTRARRAEMSWRGMRLASHVDLAEPQGGSRTRESDYVYLLAEVDAGAARVSRVLVFDVSDPLRVKPVANVVAGEATEMLELGWYYNAPFLQTVLLTPGTDGVLVTDATISAEPRQTGTLAGLRDAFVVEIEEFAIDKMLDEAGRPLKDTSHAGSRWLQLDEIGRVLSVPAAKLFPAAEEREVPEIPFETARLHFLACDADRSGVLDGPEIARAGNGFDADGDGRVLFADLAREAAPKPERTESPMQDEPRALRTRVDLDGDLSRLLDGIAPLEFDSDGDRKLDKAETSRAFFAALDLDRSGALDLDELSRAPGDLRELRYRGPWARERIAKLDDNKDGKVQPRELAVSAEDFDALDLDRNGAVDLGQRGNPWWEARGFFADGTEWPRRRRQFVALSPIATPESVLAAFDSDRDGLLTAREMRKRSDLFEELDANNDDGVDRHEIEQRLGIVGAVGVDACPDSFLDRWDLDGDGKVALEEMPSIARRLRAR
jgi:Ca2+-binding EF-hand superfamily protein